MSFGKSFFVFEIFSRFTNSGKNKEEGNGRQSVSKQLEQFVVFCTAACVNKAAFPRGTGSTVNISHVRSYRSALSDCCCVTFLRYFPEH